MKRFTFRLERIRQLRERVERERAAELGHAMRAEQDRAEALDRAHADFLRAGESAAAASREATLPAGLLGSFDMARGVASVRVDRAGEALEKARVQVGEEQERYGVARRDLRVIERLKEKRLDAWREEDAREDQKETDSLALNRHTTKEERS